MRHSFRLALLAVTTLIFPRLLASQTRTVYDVSVNPDRKEFSVAAIFPTAGKETLLVSLPAWSPGNYEIQNYARTSTDSPRRTRPARRSGGIGGIRTRGVW